MPDWTTKPLSSTTEVDLHPDLSSFPLVIRDKEPLNDRLNSVVLSDHEAHALMLLLIEHFGGVYSTG